MPQAAIDLYAGNLFGQSAHELAVDTLHAVTALYTQDPVVVQLLDLIGWPQNGGAVLDTSCGDGAFICRALERLLVLYPEMIDREVCERLQGWEIHPFAARQARSRLQEVLVKTGRSPTKAQQMAESIVYCGDFLTNGPTGRKFAAIIGNPPYLRMPNVPDPIRCEYEAMLPAHAKADLLHSFLDRCVTLLADDGELAMVTADRWLFNESAARLREVVGKQFAIAHLERLDSASTFYRPKQRRAGTPPRIHPVGLVLKAHAPGLQTIGREPFYPDGPGPTTDHSLTLGDVAEVRLAPWLGTPGIFLVDASVAANWPEGSTVPAIDTDDIQGGVLGLPKRCAILTRPETSPHQAVMAHLDAQMPRMCQRGRSKIKWMPPEPFHNFKLDEPMLLVPRIAKSLKPVRVPAGVLPVNHNLSIVRSGPLSLDEIEALLISKEAHEWISRRAPRLENGYYSITTRLLRTLPVFGRQ